MKNWMILILILFFSLIILNYVNALTYSDCSIYGNCIPTKVSSGGVSSGNITNYWTTNTDQSGLTNKKGGTYTLADNSNVNSISPDNRLLYSQYAGNPVMSIDWASKILYALQSGTPKKSVDWNFRTLYDVVQSPVIEWNAHNFYGNWNFNTGNVNNISLLESNKALFGGAVDNTFDTVQVNGTVYVENPIYAGSDSALMSNGYSVWGKLGSAGTSAGHFDANILGDTRVVDIIDNSGNAINSYGKDYFTDGTGNINLFSGSGYASGSNSIATFYGSGFQSVDLGVSYASVYASANGGQYQATLGDTLQGSAGWFYDGTHNVKISSGSYAIDSDGNSYFHDGVGHSVNLADGTYAIKSVGLTALKPTSNIPQLFLQQDNTNEPDANGWKLFADSGSGFFDLIRTGEGASPTDHVRLRMTTDGRMIIDPSESFADDATSALQIKGVTSVTGNIINTLDNTYDIGDSTNYFKTAYINTIQGGTSYANTMYTGNIRDVSSGFHRIDVTNRLLNGTWTIGTDLNVTNNEYINGSLFGTTNRYLGNFNAGNGSVVAMNRFDSSPLSNFTGINNSRFLVNTMFNFLPRINYKAGLSSFYDVNVYLNMSLVNDTFPTNKANLYIDDIKSGTGYAIYQASTDDINDFHGSSNFYGSVSFQGTSLSLPGHINYGTGVSGYPEAYYGIGKMSWQFYDDTGTDYNVYWDGSHNNDITFTTDAPKLTLNTSVDVKNNLNVTGTITTANASSYTNQVVCYLAGGKLGHCTSIVGVTGACTCVAN